MFCPGRLVNRVMGGTLPIAECCRGLFYVLSSGLRVGVVLGVESFEGPVEVAG